MSLQKRLNFLQNIGTALSPERPQNDPKKLSISRLLNRSAPQNLHLFRQVPFLSEQLLEWVVLIKCKLRVSYHAGLNMKSAVTHKNDCPCVPKHRTRASKHFSLRPRLRLRQGNVTEPFKSKELLHPQQSGIELDDAHQDNFFFFGDIESNRLDQVGDIDSDFDKDVKYILDGHFWYRDETAVSIVHYEVATKLLRRKIVDAASAIGHIT